MFVSVTRIKAPEEAIRPMVAGFRKGATDLKRFKGFLGLELWTNENGLEAVSRWESRDAMMEYVNSPAFRSHHSDKQQQGEIVSYDVEVVV